MVCGLGLPVLAQQAATAVATAPANAASAALPSVQVTAHALDRDEKPYRDLIKAMDIFEREHARAPHATMRFKLYPWRDPAALQDLKLFLRTSSGQQAIAVASDGSFELPRDAKALADDAVVVSNRPSRSLAWRPDIRTPGLAPDTRRLGDLRLECKVDLEGTGAGLATGVKPPAFWAIAAVTDPCLVRGVGYVWFSEQALFGVTLVSGQRHKPLSSDFVLGTFAVGGIFALMDWQVLLRDRAFTLPLWDKDWPDDTLVQLEPMEDQKLASAGVQP